MNMEVERSIDVSDHMLCNGEENKCGGGDQSHPGGLQMSAPPAMSGYLRGILVHLFLLI